MVLRTNGGDLVKITVAGQIAHPLASAAPYRIGHDGVPRILPGTGGVVTNFRIGDRCVGMVGDHIEPAVSLHNNKSEIVGKKNGPNLALITYACVGNMATVLTGPCRGKRGIVTGKHGGVAHLLLDFSTEVLRRLRIGDQIQILAHGLGMRFPDYPEVAVFSCSPGLVKRWGLHSRSGRIQVPVTHVVPAAIMGSGIGRSSAVRGDYDIQLFDPIIRRKFELENLRFGDILAILDSDNRFGRGYQGGAVTVGIVVHSDSTVSGHGPGVMTLLSGPGRDLRLLRTPKANLAVMYGVRSHLQQRSYKPIVRMKKMKAAGGGISA